MNDNSYFKQNTITNTSGDSYSLLWRGLGENINIPRRKSRLGFLKKQACVLSDLKTNDAENSNVYQNKADIHNSVGFKSEPVNITQDKLEHKHNLQHNDFYKSSGSSSDDAVSKELNSLDLSSPIEDIWRHDLKPQHDSPSIEEFTPMRDIISSTSVGQSLTIDEYKTYHTSIENFFTTNEYNVINERSCSVASTKLPANEIEPVNCQNFVEVIPTVDTPGPMEFEIPPISDRNQFDSIPASATVPIQYYEPKMNNPVAPVDKNEFVSKRESNKPSVRFAELPPPVSSKMPGSQNSSKVPLQITVNNESYKVLNVLGKGGSSVVYQVLHPETNESLAVKRVKLTNTDETVAQGYLDEVKMLEELQNCDVIIKMFNHELTYENNKKILYVVMEKGDTDLSELIRNASQAKKLSIPMIVYYWSEMLSAVKEIHNRGIIHSDLKPANFLLVRGRLKLIDFGIASSVQGDMTSVYKDVFCGTLNYMSPEAVNYVQCPTGPNAGYRITYKTDVWSLGCILYNLIYGKLPFQHINKRMEKMCAIVDPKTSVEFPEIKDVPFVLMDSLRSCLIKDPKTRPSVSQLLDRIMRVYTSNNN